MPERHEPTAALHTRAAQYLRMSTEHQQYSTDNQSECIRHYAELHGIEIVRTYSDEGKSGLNLNDRGALRDLLDDVQNGRADYKLVLVYDVSRWGRFQDSDEGAYYEFVCKRANVGIRYCAEQFDNDGSLPSSLLKTIKRAMAAEYSRELSAKVIVGQNRLVKMGFRQGGSAGYGLRRQLLDRNGCPKGFLGPNEQKSIQTDRVILVPGPEDEVNVVHEIYDLFIEGHKTEKEIADELNERGVLTDRGKRWQDYIVRRILTNPKYAGINVRNLSSVKLKQKRVMNPPEMWIRCEKAFQPIVTRERFDQACAMVDDYHRRLTDQECLTRLRTLLARAGTLSTRLIDGACDVPNVSQYKRRFGSLRRAYSLIGYVPRSDYRYMDARMAIREWGKEQRTSIIARLREQGAEVEKRKCSILLINQEFTASLVIVLCRKTRAGNLRWYVELYNYRNPPDVTIAIRLKPDNKEILDFYLLPKIEITRQITRLALTNNFGLDVYRFDNLDLLTSIVRRIPVEEVVCTR